MSDMIDTIYTTAEQAGWRMSIIQTFSGQAVDTLAVEPSKVRIEDVAHALALKNRFTGHTRFPYSVAQHCILGAGALRFEGASTATQLAFLLHELSEVYLPDVSGPLKPFVRVAEPGCGKSWTLLEAQHQAACLAGLGLPDGWAKGVSYSAVRDMDVRMLALEAVWLLPGDLIPAWDTVAAKPSRRVGIREWPWRDAESRFLRSFEQLRREVAP